MTAFLGSIKDAAAPSLIELHVVQDNLFANQAKNLPTTTGPELTVRRIQ